MNFRNSIVSIKRNHIQGHFVLNLTKRLQVTTKGKRVYRQSVKIVAPTFVSKIVTVTRDVTRDCLLENYYNSLLQK